MTIEEALHYLTTRDYHEEWNDNGEIDSSFHKIHKGYEFYFDFRVWQFKTKKGYCSDVSELSVVHEDSMDEHFTQKQRHDLEIAIEKELVKDIEEYEAPEDHAWNLGE